MTAPHTPVVFVHGLWLHSTSWQAWLELFTGAGYDASAPEWPGVDPTVAEARQHPEKQAGKALAEIIEHHAAIIRELDPKPVVIGHSFGGLIAQSLLAQGLAVAAVAIDPAPMKGILILPPAQLKASSPVLGNPANRKKAVSLNAKQFRYAFGNAVSEAESARLHEQWTIPAPGRPLFEAAFANFSPHSPAAVDTKKADRGPLLLISGKQDHTVPDSVTRAVYKKYRHSSAVTDLKQFDNRGHSLTVDSGWREIADEVIAWLKAHDL